MLRSLLPTLVLFYALVLAILNFQYERLILVPTQEPLPANEDPPPVRHLTEAGVELWAHQYRPHVGRRIRVLHFVGNASRAERELPSFLPYLPELIGAEVWCVNYPGYGGSSGAPRLKNFPKAALAAFDLFLSTTNAQGPGGAMEKLGPVIISGNSLGTAMALWVARHRPADAVWLRNAPPLAELILGEYGQWYIWPIAWPVASFIPSELDSLKNASKVEAPGLFLSSSQDQVVPVSYQKRVYDAYRGKHQIIELPGAGHNDEVPTAAAPVLQRALQDIWGARP